MNTTGAIIRSIRTAKGLSQEYIANELEIKQAAYSNIESNKTDVTISRLREIAKLLEVTVFDLIPSENNFPLSEPTGAKYPGPNQGYEVSITIKLNDASKEHEVLRLIGLK